MKILKQAEQWPDRCAAAEWEPPPHPRTKQHPDFSVAVPNSQYGEYQRDPAFHSLLRDMPNQWDTGHPKFDRENNWKQYQLQQRGYRSQQNTSLHYPPEGVESMSHYKRPNSGVVVDQVQDTQGNHWASCY